MNNNKLFFPALTGYRAIAAWMIFIYHFFPFKNESHSYPKWIANIVWEFHIGVDMFFVLSGFLITYRYFNENPIDFKKYMVNRFARIYPMYFLITVGVFISGYLTSGIWTQEKTIEALLSFTMTKALFKDYFLGGVAQGWTLTLEEMFYVTAPLYFILIRKRKIWLYLLPILIFIFGFGMKEIFSNFFNLGGFLQKNIAVYIIEFFVGIGLALFINRQSKRIQILKNKVAYVGIGFILVYLIGMQYFRAVFDLKYDPAVFVSMGVLSLLGIAPLLWGLIHERTFISKILSTPFMVLLGKSSYIFYLIHKGFIPIFINDNICSNKLFIFVILNIISIVLFKYIEEPANLWIRKCYSKNNN
ncbi:acyltransferase family protein [Riemerella anatipestifer]|uniref:acyltransferase family protein n=1 Tax=Riemerella anatipestifer TaxID=34085 RepID=UPI00069C20AF|nr:acyltransferase [Riemerella anatipestifer]